MTSIYDVTECLPTFEVVYVVTLFGASDRKKGTIVDPGQAHFQIIHMYDVTFKMTRDLYLERAIVPLTDPLQNLTECTI